MRGLYSYKTRFNPLFSTWGLYQVRNTTVGILTFWILLRIQYFRDFTFYPILTQIDDFNLKFLTNVTILSSQFSISHFSAVAYHMSHCMIFTYFSRYHKLVHVHTLRPSYIGVRSLCRDFSKIVMRRRIKNDTP